MVSYKPKSQCANPATALIRDRSTPFETNIRLKTIFLILGLTILASCNLQPKKEGKISKEQVLENIQTLRNAGFFEVYESMSDLEVYDTIYADRKKRYSEIFEKQYDPGMDLDAIQLAEYDRTKLLFIDLEADVAMDNNIYVEVIKAFRILSNNKFEPTDIKEQWTSETGPIEVSFKSDGSLIKFEPEYQDDWLHESVFKICQEELERKSIRITDCLSDDGYGYGQAIAIMRLSEKEQKILENKLNWKFTQD